MHVLDATHGYAFDQTFAVCADLSCTPPPGANPARGRLVRRYIHGTSRIDERAVLLEGDSQPLDGTSPTVYNVDAFYYLLRELNSVTGLVTRALNTQV